MQERAASTRRRRDEPSPRPVALVPVSRCQTAQRMANGIVGWAKSPAVSLPFRDGPRAIPARRRGQALPTRSLFICPIRVGTALHCPRGESRAFGPRLCPPYATIRYSLPHTLSFPRRVAPGVWTLPFIHPRGVAERRDGARVQRHPQRAERVQDARERAFARHARRLRGALSSPSGGTRASRRSTVAIF